MTKENFKAGYHVRISKHKSHFAKRCTPNSSEEVFVIKKFQSTVPWIYAINDLNGEEIVRMFIKKNCKKQIKQNLEQKKLLKEKVINYMSK